MLGCVVSLSISDSAVKRLVEEIEGFMKAAGLDPEKDLKKYALKDTYSAFKLTFYRILRGKDGVPLDEMRVQVQDQLGNLCSKEMFYRVLRHLVQKQGKVKLSYPTYHS